MTPELMEGQQRRPSEAGSDRGVDRFVVHGVRLKLASDHPRAAAAIRRRLRRFEAHRVGVAASNGEEPAEISVEIDSVAENGEHAFDRPAVAMRPVYDAPAGDVLYARASDQLYIDYLGRVRVLCDAGTGRIRISIRSRPRTIGGSRRTRCSRCRSSR